jgi:uncharacterized protein
MLSTFCSCFDRPERHPSVGRSGAAGAASAGQFRRALVTGATSGIGAAFAEALPATTDLLLTGRNKEKLEEAARRLAVGGRQVDIVVADLANEHDIERLIEHADAAGIDLLINNAGAGRLGRIVDNAAKTERDTVAINVLAVVLLTRRLLPGMIARARSTENRAGIIILASTAAFTSVPYFATYAASKAFDLSFAEALGEEMRSEPVDVLALCPGATRTSFGGSAGFTGRTVPGAADPRSVARQALRALGRQRIKVTGSVSEAAFGPFLLPRRIATFGIGTLMRVLAATMAEPRGGSPAQTNKSDR